VAKALAVAAAAAVAAGAAVAVVAVVAAVEDDGDVAATVAQAAWVARSCQSAFSGKPKTSFGSYCCGQHSSAFGQVVAGD